VGQCKGFPNYFFANAVRVFRLIACAGAQSDEVWLMKFLVENAESLEYLGNSGKWCKDPGKGRDFGTVQSAKASAKLEPIGKFNIVGYLSKSGQLINMDRGTGKGGSSN
jgi:hypothetical protein